MLALVSQIMGDNNAFGKKICVYVAHEWRMPQPADANEEADRYWREPIFRQKSEERSYLLFGQIIFLQDVGLGGKVKFLLADGTFTYQGH